MSAATTTDTHSDSHGTSSAFEATRSLVLSAAAIFADYDEALRSARLSAESRLALLGLQALGVTLPAPESIASVTVLTGLPAAPIAPVLPVAPEAVPVLPEEPVAPSPVAPVAAVSAESVRTPRGLKRTPAPARDPGDKPRAGKRKCPGEGCPSDCYGEFCRSCAQKAGTYGNNAAARKEKKVSAGRPEIPVGTKATAETPPVPVFTAEPMALTLSQMRHDLPAVRSKGMMNRTANEQGWFIVAFVDSRPYPGLDPLTDATLPENAQYIETCKKRGNEWYSGEVMIGRSQFRSVITASRNGSEVPA